jgi:hypothetical protein
MRRAIACCGVVAASAVGSVAAGATRDAHIAGRVLECNTPEHCIMNRFIVSAVNSTGRTVARTSTWGDHNRYRLRVAPGSYQLLARSSGLVCKASAAAEAHETTQQNITCPVP